MPADDLNSGWYGATSVQYRVDVGADGTLTLHYLNYPSVPDQVLLPIAATAFRDTTGTALLAFVRERTERPYLYQRPSPTLPGLGGCPPPTMQQ